LTLIIPPAWLIQSADLNNYAKAPITGTYIQGIETPLLKSSLSETPTTARLKDYLKYEFAKYGIEDQYDRAVSVVFCESGWNVNPKPNGISYGIAQFTKPTWQDFGHGDIMNPYNQLEVMANMWSLKLQGRWDCFSGRR